MQRSTGITVTAVLAFVGSGFTLLGALGVALMSAVLPASRAAYGPPRTFLLLGVIYYLAIAAWGIVTGVGLLKLREWARISELIFSGLLVLVGVGAGVAMLFIPFPTLPNDANPALTAQIMSFTKVGIAASYGFLAVLGGWWLYYFNQSSIRAQFRASQFPSSELTATALPAFGTPPEPPLGSFVLPPPNTPARPVSISIIAVLLLLGAAMVPLSLLSRTPLLFFGFLIGGWRGYLLALALSAANLAAGVGLFNLKLWARTLAICVTIFAILNATFTVFVPGSQSRWDQAMQAIYEKWGFPSNMPVPHFPLWLTMLPAIPFALIELYFLISRKPAFLARAEDR